MDWVYIDEPPAGYKHADSLYTSPDGKTCELCDKHLKTGIRYPVVEENRRLYMMVGSECVSRFMGRSGASLKKQGILDKFEAEMSTIFSRSTLNSSGGASQEVSDLIDYLRNNSIKYIGRSDLDRKVELLKHEYHSKYLKSKNKTTSMKSFQSKYSSLLDAIKLAISDYDALT
jgi:hypothetical protein